MIKGKIQMEKKQLRGSAMLALTAFIWGVAFVAQSVGMDYVGPFTFNAVRSLIGGIVLLPCIWLLDRFRAGGRKGDGALNRRQVMERQEDGALDRRQAVLEQEPCSFFTGRSVSDRKAVRDLLMAGGCCGLALCVASSLQQIGVSHTTVGKAGFLTALYIVFVPLLGIFLKRRAGLKIWISVALAAVGLYFLCMTEGFKLSAGDFYVFLCAFVFAVHILCIDHFSGRVDPVRLSCVQFLVSGILCSIPMALTEKPQLSAIFSGAIPILYAGVLSCGVAYTLQVVAQRDTDPTVASLILSLESVFSVLAGWILLGQSLSPREIGGCALMFAAILLAQLPERTARSNL